MLHSIICQKKMLNTQIETTKNVVTRVVVTDSLSYCSKNYFSLTQPLKLKQKESLFLEVSFQGIFLQKSWIRKDCFQNKSKFIAEVQFTKHMDITIS